MHTCTHMHCLLHPVVSFGQRRVRRESRMKVWRQRILNKESALGRMSECCVSLGTQCKHLVLAPQSALGPGLSACSEHHSSWVSSSVEHANVLSGSQKLKSPCSMVQMVAWVCYAASSCSIKPHSNQMVIDDLCASVMSLTTTSAYLGWRAFVRAHHSAI